jgi:diacylglycerol kinase family enzyme
MRFAKANPVNPSVDDGQQLHHHPRRHPTQTGLQVRIALVHNDSAGYRVYSASDLVRLLRDGGNDVELFTRDSRSIGRAIDTRPDVLVASGGDGTIAEAAIALRASGVPLYILPTGTSNNIARGVGLGGAIPSLVSRLVPRATSARLDIGRISTDGQQAYFVEAVGTGFMGAALEAHRRPLRRLWRPLHNLARSPAVRWERALRGIARLVRRMPARHIDIRADGEDLSGEYITVKVMNISAVGPQIVLAPNAKPGDARLDLVLVRAADREALAKYVASPRSNGGPPPLWVRQAERVELDWPVRDAHVDDEPWTPQSNNGGPHRVSIDIAGATHLLVPAVQTT